MAKIVDSRSPVPVRLQLRNILLEEVRDRVFAPNQKIPSERGLAERYQASRATVREAIGELISEGILFRSGGRGTFVSPRPSRSVKTPRALAQAGFWISDQIFQFVQAGYNRILTGVEDVCRGHGFSLRFHSVNEQKESLDLLFGEQSDAHSLAGNIIVGGLQQAALDRLYRLDLPLVVVDMLLRREIDGADSVRIDYAQGTREAVRHLVRLGHRDIGFIGFPESEKYEEFWRALESSGLAYSPRFTQFCQMPDIAPSIMAGYQCASRLIAADRRPTALVTTNDYVALGALEALSVAGLSVPEDMSLVGFDDIGQGGVPLTTVRVDLAEAGRVAAHTLFDRLERPDAPPRHVTVPVELVVRRSTASPRVMAAMQGG